jgi:hypothetical protein
VNNLWASNGSALKLAILPGPEMVMNLYPECVPLRPLAALDIRDGW